MSSEENNDKEFKDKETDIPKRKLIANNLFFGVFPSVDLRTIFCVFSC